MDRDAGIETKGHLLGYSFWSPAASRVHTAAIKTPQETRPSACLQADGLPYCRSSRITMCFSLVLPCKKQPLQHCLHRAQISIQHRASLWPFPWHGFLWEERTTQRPYCKCSRALCLRQEQSGVCQNVKPRGNRCPPHPPHCLAF